jgi:DNA-binding CsgD family transcriptional regulator/tetratricopeptide (TPR) repeat protein
MVAHGMRQLLERDEALARMHAALEATRASHHGRTLLVRGEAGIGKTTLLQVWAREVQQRGGTEVLWGGCEALFTPRPLGPVIDIAAKLGPSVREAAAEQRSTPQLFAAIAQWLATPVPLPGGRRGEIRVHALVFEDVHWADHLTLDFLKFLSRRIHQWPVLLVMSYRDDEVGAMHPLTQVIGELPTGDTVAIDVQPLTRGALADLSGLSNAHVSELHRITAGNPFFATEVLATTLQGQGAVPSTVTAAVLARAQRVGVSARKVLDAASLSPMAVESALLTHLVGDAAIEGVDECVQAGLLRWTERGLTFRHELARRAIEASLSPLRRRDLHSRILEQLRQAHTDLVDRQAYHAREADDGQAVLATAPAAAAKAAQLGAHREAASHYRSAIDHAQGASAQQRAELLERWAYESRIIGSIEPRVFQAHHDAMTLRRAAGDLENVGMNQTALSTLSRMQGRMDDSEQWLAQAIATLESIPPGPELARAYSARSARHMLRNEWRDAQAWGERAIELARRFGLPDTHAHALNNVGSALVDHGELRGFDLLEQSLAISLEHGLHDHAARAYANLVEAALRSRMLARAERVVAEGMAFARDHDLDDKLGHLVGSSAQAKAMQGRLDEALALARAELERRPGVENLVQLTLHSVIDTVTMLRDVDARAGALETLWPRVRQLGEPDLIVPVALAMAESTWLRGAQDACRQVVTDTLAANHGFTQWDWGELACWYRRAGGDPDTLFDAPMAEPCRLEVDGDTESAAAAWAVLDMPRHRAHALLARPLDGDPDPQAISDAIGLFDRIGAAACAQHARRVARRLATSGTRGVKTGPRAAARGNRFGLTPRELEIARHLARGSSNQQIAQSLSRSERTIEHHVSTVLSKLGAKRRADVAAFVNELG